MILKKNQNLKIATILPYKENYSKEKLQQLHYGYLNFIKNQNLKKTILYSDILNPKIF